MASITIKINMDNAAFDPPSYEVARILKELAECIECDGIDNAPAKLRDINGNTVGTVEIED